MEMRLAAKSTRALIGPMLARFMASDRAFAKLRPADATPQRAVPENPTQKIRRERAASRMDATTVRWWGLSRHRQRYHALA
jgi:hypothetical protein